MNSCCLRFGLLYILNPILSAPTLGFGGAFPSRLFLIVIDSQHRKYISSTATQRPLWDLRGLLGEVNLCSTGFRTTSSMSGHLTRRARSDDELATTFEHSRGAGGQGHDRIHGDTLVPGVSSPIAMAGDSDDVDIDITAGQKMISAMSGSLLTSLLGMPFISKTLLQDYNC